MSCGVDLGNQYMVIGGKGEGDGRKVTLYKDTGFYKMRRELNLGRYGQACAKFLNGEGEKVGSVFPV